MFDRLQKPFLTVETGEAYQPIRLTYELIDRNGFLTALRKIKCIQQKPSVSDSWNWYWQAECDDLHFESLDSFRKNPQHPVRLGTLTIKNQKLFINLPSFKRACMAVPFFHRLLDSSLIRIHHADFVNKVFAIDERLSHGFTELFREDELEQILHQRMKEYQELEAKCENAATAEDAFNILSNYTHTEAKKRLPHAERYLFELNNNVSPDVVFLGFYIFLRGRELVAIKRWSGEVGYSLASAADETIEQVFGGMGIDIID